MTEQFAPEFRVMHRLPETFWQQVMATPFHYDLFQLLRRLDAQGGERHLLGRAPLPHFEPIRLGQEPSLAFAPATVSRIAPRAGSALHDITIYSFGLFGPNGPLPLHMTEYARERISHYGDTSMSAFLDLFHHRLTLLFYRAWADAQPTVSLDRPDHHRFNHYLASLIGAGQPVQQENHSSISEHARYALSGHLTRQGHDAEGLEKILAWYFKVNIRIVANIPQWLYVNTREQAQLRGGRGRPRLGQNTFLGIAVRDIQHKFRIELGPLTLENYHQFLPDRPLSSQLRDWVRQYLGIEYSWAVRLILRRQEVTGTRIGGNQRLGFSSWLGEQPQPVDRGDLIFSLENEPGASLA